MGLLSPERGTGRHVSSPQAPRAPAFAVRTDGRTRSPVQCPSASVTAPPRDGRRGPAGHTPPPTLQFGAHGSEPAGRGCPRSQAPSPRPSCAWDWPEPLGQSCRRPFPDPPSSLLVPPLGPPRSPLSQASLGRTEQVAALCPAKDRRTSQSEAAQDSVTGQAPQTVPGANTRDRSWGSQNQGVHRTRSDREALAGLWGGRPRGPARLPPAGRRPSDQSRSPR